MFKVEHLIAYGVLSAAVAFDLAQHIHIKTKIDQILEVNDILEQQLSKSDARAKYLANKLMQNDIPFDEFDLIVLNNPT